MYVRSGATWSQQAHLKASNGAAVDYFGYSVACRATPLWWAPREASEATGVNGNQSAMRHRLRRGLCVYAQRHDLERAGLSQSFQRRRAADRIRLQPGPGGRLALVVAFAKSSSGHRLDGNRPDYAASQSGAAYVYTRSGRPGDSRPISSPPMPRRMILSATA